MREAERLLWGKQKGKNWMNDEHVVSLYIIVVAWS